MARITGGEAVVSALIGHEVKTVFGLPGVQNDALFAALYDSREAIQLIHTRHEQGAAYMALGYALSSDRVGVYSVVPGPGVLNTTAALATGYATNARMLCLTGQIQSSSIGRGYGLLHEIPDQLGILRSLTKWAARITTPAEAPDLVAEAFKQLASGRPRPVALEVPPDVLAARSEVHPTDLRYEAHIPPLDLDAIERAAKLLAKAKQPMIIVGSGAVDAASSIQQLAELLQAPVVSGRSGNGILSSRHPLSLRLPEAYLLWPKVDVVLAIGTRLQAPLMNWGYDADLSVIRIDLDPAEQTRITPPAVGITARSQDAVPSLYEATTTYCQPRPSRSAECDALRAQVAAKIAFLEPQLGFLQAIRAELPDDGFFVEEMTQVGYVSRFALPIYHPRTYVSTGYQGTLGWGFATALGVKVAHPDKCVLSITGDGGFMFNVQELATAVQHQIATVTVVFNDGAFGNVRRTQQQQYGNRVLGSELRNPDFIRLAEAFGAQAFRVETPTELRAVLRRGFAANGPTLIEVPVGEMPSSWPMVFLPRVRPQNAG